MRSSLAGVDTGHLLHFILQKGAMVGIGGGGGGGVAGGGGGALGNGHFGNWVDSKVLADHSQQTDSSTNTDDKNQAYVQQLENSRVRLSQLEQELKRARHQGVFIASGLSGDQSHSVSSNGALAFDTDYARLLDEYQRLIYDLRSAVNTHVGKSELRLLVYGVMSHYDEIFRLKSIGSKSNICHMLSGMRKTPVERCFMWLGGFRASELLKQSSQQVDDALSQGMEALQQSFVETLSSNSPGPSGSTNMADYIGQMAITMGKLSTFENFLH